MPEFITKLQYKTFEKGEYADEKVRNVEETIELIKKFPWNTERGADVQLTGPSVTIQDEYVNFLKVGLYFNGKYCLYYLDRDNHLYEYHAPDLDDACTVVTNFFNDQLDLQKFDKHAFSSGSKKHFEDGLFEFTLSYWAFYPRFIFSLLLSIVLVGCAIMIIVLSAPIFFKLFFIPLEFSIGILGLFSCYLQWLYYEKCKGMYLNISSGNNVFKFGVNDDISDYKKTDISEINIYGSTSGKGPQVLTLIEINFINGSKITFPGLLIDPRLFTTKVIGTNVNLKQVLITFRKEAWEFAHTK